MNITENAPAKINLYLHVTGRREDGYHLLDSLVVFAGPGEASDHVGIEAASAYSLVIAGPQGALLNREDLEKNLITKALRNFAGKLGRKPDVAVTLHKNLPVASGIGGGSADAAAALRGAARLWGVALDDPRLLDAAKDTGADVPGCLLSQPCYFGGIGDEIIPVKFVPRFSLLLVNPLIPVITAEVFQNRGGGFKPAARFQSMPTHVGELVAGLKMRSNDLEHAAISRVEAIADVLSVLGAQQGCLFTRMSGSGATCFGIFAEKEEAERTAKHIREQIREYWVAVTEIG